MWIFFLVSTSAEFFSAPSGYKLAVRRWQVPSPRATVILQHGGGWHSGYFSEVGKALQAVNFSVVALDAMGHGNSEGPGGVTQWTSLEEVREDLRAFVASQPSPKVLLGESMGVLILTPTDINGIIFCGGLFKMAKKTAVPWPVIQVLKLIHLFKPGMQLKLPTLNATFDSAFGDPKWAATARNDPHIVVNAFYLGSMMDVMKAMPRVRKMTVEVPTLMMHSKTDTRTDVDAAVKFFENIAVEDKTLILYDDASHQLFQDSDANVERAINDLQTWLEAHFPTCTNPE